MSVPSAALPLDAENLRNYRNEGVLLVRDLIPQDFVQTFKARILETLLRLCRKRDYAIPDQVTLEDVLARIVDSRGLHEARGLRHDIIQELGFSCPDQLNQDSSLVACLSQLLDQPSARIELFALRCNIAGQSTSHDGVFPWHQDGEHYKLALWIPLTPSTVANGCLHVIPRCHEHKLEHRRFGEENKQIFTFSEAYPEERITPVPSHPGDAIVIDQLTPHATYPNKTNKDRWAFVLWAN